MDKLPVGQLPDLQQSNNDDEIMVITNSEYNQLKKEKISDLITDFTSTNENNALTKGTDGKMFVTDFGNASNITEGTLPTSVLPDIPKDKLPEIEITDLPESGVTANTYAYPASVTVNAQGQVTAIEEGAPGANNANQDLSNISEAGKEVIRETAGSDYHLTQNQITNCILEAPGGGIAYTETTVTAKAGLRYLTGNGRNADYTLKTAEHTLQNDVSVTFNGFGANTQGIAYIFNGVLMYCPINEVYHVDNSPTVEAPVANAGTNQLWFEKWNNVVYHSIYGSTEWVLTTDCVIIGTFYPNSSGKITGIRRNRPVDILKRSDKNEVAGWGFPSSTYIDLTLSGTGTAYTAPADGYVVFGKQATARDQHVLLVQSGAVWQICWATAIGEDLFVSMPVKKGRIFNASYATLGPTRVF